jgi:hypothetical protein
VRGFRPHADNCPLSPKPIRPLELAAPVTRDAFQGTEIIFVSASSQLFGASQAEGLHALHPAREAPQPAACPVGSAESTERSAFEACILADVGNMDLSMDEEQSAAESIQGREQLPHRFTVKALASDIAVLLLQLSFVLAILLSGALAAHEDLRNASSIGRVDFRNRYSAGYMVRTGHGSEIYDAGAEKMFQDELVSKADLPLPFIPPAYEALFFAPFSFLPFRPAYYAFLGFNLALLLLCMRLLRRYMSNLARVDSCLPSFAFLFTPITVALLQGQDPIILLALLAGALICIQRDREYMAGGLVALGLFKFQFVIPIFLLFLVWRRWRFSAGFVCMSAALAGVSIWILGMAESVRYFHSILGAGSSLGSVAGPTLRMNLMANFHGAFDTILKGSSSVLPLTAAASAATMIWVASRRPHGVDALLIAIPASALVSYYMYIHDMSILIIPVVVMLDRLAGAAKEGRPYGRIRMMTPLLMLAAPTVLILAPDQFWAASLPLLAFTFAIAWRQPAVAA